MGLSKKQEAWLNAYLTTWNEREACRMTGYSTQSGYWLKHRPEIARRIREELEKVGVTKDEVMRTLARLTRSNLGDAVEMIDVKDEDGKKVGKAAVLSIEKAVESGLIADVSEMKMKRGGLVEIKLVDKLRALGFAMKALGMGDGEATESEDEWWAQTEKDA